MGDRKITDVKAKNYKIPLEEKLEGSNMEHRHFELIIVDVKLADNSRGVGYTYTVGLGGRAISILINDYLSSIITGLDADRVKHINNILQKKTDYIGKTSYVKLNNGNE